MSTSLPLQRCQFKKAARVLSVALLTILLSACGGGGSNDQAGQCSADAQKQWAYDGMQDFYLFSDQVPVVNPRSYESADKLVKAVRFEELDPYSHVSDAKGSSLLFDEGREFGLGYGWAWDTSEKPRISRVEKNSPFSLAGVERGDIIISVDGLLWTDERLRVNFQDRVTGTPDNPSTASWTFEKRDTGESVTRNITGAEYQVSTVISREVYFDPDSQVKVGYLAFSRFLDTSRQELDSAFEYFQNENISELILDLRYNGGGRTSIAKHLASLIAGNSFAGDAIYNYRFNDKYSRHNYSLNFHVTGFGVNLSRLVVLTSPRTASSSEIVISGLQPYIDVVTLGGKTNGKPYSSWPYDRCGERLNLVEAVGLNASENNVFRGIEPTCFASDDLTRNFGQSEDSEFEGMLGAGMEYIVQGTCPSAPTVIASRSRSSSAASTVGNPIDERQGISLLGGALNESR